MTTSVMCTEACATCGLWATCNTPGMIPNGPLATKQGAPLLIGEGPGEAEDLDAVQFVGDSGDVLRVALLSNGFAPEKCWMTNAIQCRPPGNRTPSAKEIGFCRERVLAQIEDLRPSIILLLGAAALTSVLKKSGITKCRRRVFEHVLTDGTKVPVVPAFHPSYVLHDANQKSRFEGDIKFFVDVLRTGRTVSDEIAKARRCVNISPTVAEITEFHRLARLNHTPVAWDVETNTLEPDRSNSWRLLCLSVATTEKALVVPLDYPGDPASGRYSFTMKHAGLPRTLAWDALKALLTDPAVPKIAHNAKYDMKCCQLRLGYEVTPVVDDTLVMHSLLYPIEGGHDLKSIAAEELGLAGYDADLLEIVGEKEAGKNFPKVPYEKLGMYCGIDGLATAWLRDIFATRMLQRDAEQAADGVPYKPLTQLYRELIIPALQSLYQMERAGFHVREKHLADLEVKFTVEVEGLLKVLCSTGMVRRYVDAKRAVIVKEFQQKRKAGRKVRTGTLTKRIREAEFNPGSDAQVADLLFTHNRDRFVGEDWFGVVPDKGAYTAGGRPQCNKDSLEAVLVNPRASAEARQFTQQVLLYKSASKLLSTFIVGLRKHIGVDGSVHSSFNLGVTRTGRLSSNDPNLQNIPKRKDFRSIFGAGPGNTLVMADYSQVELRVLAAFCRDSNLMEVYRQDKDLHLETAMSTLGVSDPNLVSSEDRDGAKAVNFGVVYGLTEFGLARDLSKKRGEPVSPDEASVFIEGFYSRFPGVKSWQDQVHRYVKQHGYVYTMFGRRRNIANAMMIATRKDQYLKLNDALRQAVNTPVQGTASDITLCALVELNRQFKVRHILARAVSIVHDEIIVEVANDPETIKEVIALMQEVMCKEPLKWINIAGIPLKVDFKVGSDWGSAVALP